MTTVLRTRALETECVLASPEIVAELSKSILSGRVTPLSLTLWTKESGDTSS